MKRTTPMMPLAQAVMERCAVLATCSEETGRITRPFGSEAMRLANTALRDWMQAAGMQVRQDNIGNLIGRYAGLTEAAPTLLIGSHLDSVRDAGKYDGPLGVLVALACIERLHAEHKRLPVAIEVVAFADEEGLRFHSTYLGSSVVAGTFDRALLDLADHAGMSLADAIRAFGGEPDQVWSDQHSAQTVIGYGEVHIEQGPQLEAEQLALGVVTAIAGQTRVRMTLQGMAGHAGTVPMNLRRDALCAAAECVLAIEQAARQRAGLVATVGQLEVAPGASNVVPGNVTLSLDLRHADDHERQQALQALHTELSALCAARSITFGWQVMQEQAAVACDQHLTALLGQALSAYGYPVRELVSGAGHDGVAITALAPVAMLFVRCEGGISHHPAEAVAVADVASAIEVWSHWIELVAEQAIDPAQL